MALIPYTGQHQLDLESFRPLESAKGDSNQSIQQVACAALVCSMAAYTCLPFKGCQRLQSPLIKRVQKLYGLVASIWMTIWLVSAQRSNKHLIIPRLRFACGFGPPVAMVLRSFTPLDRRSPSVIAEKVGMIGALVVCALQFVQLCGMAFGRGGAFHLGNRNDRVFIVLALLPWPFVIASLFFRELNQGIEMPSVNFFCGFGPPSSLE